MKLKKLIILLPAVLMTFSISSCKGQTQSKDDAYTYKSGSFDGIGKFYMGREISHVMGHQGMNWLERPEREQEEETSTLLKNMNLQPTDVIADIGAGSGYHVFKMAPQVGKGKVFAVDIQPEMLNAMKKKKNDLGQSNVKLIKGEEKSTELPENKVDKVLMVDVYHEFEFPIKMIQSIKNALKPTGKIYLIEYRAEDASVPIKRLHKMTEDQAVKEMNAAGFKLIENIDNLPWQHCMVFGIE